MKRFLLAFVCLLISISTFSQFTWTWLKGPSRINGYGNYGIQGVAAPSNNPGNRTGQATWKDSAGDIWIFGGRGLSRNGSFYLSDMWKYSPKTDQWTWMGGSQLANQKGNYGNKGIASPANAIRARAYAANWTDDQGNFWIYGGEGYEVLFNAEPQIYLSDLWRYTPSSGVWTWMGGNKSENIFTLSLNYRPVYGKQGVAAVTGDPGSRKNASFWKDRSGDFWVFGGYGFNNGFTTCNDLWKYSLATGLWTFISGDTTQNPTGVYALKGQPGKVNRPSGRLQAAGWADNQNDFWIFGGSNSVLNSTVPFNDLWRYSTVTGEWTWMKGDSVNARAQYLPDNAGDVNVNPGPRAAPVAWRDDEDQFWIYGGRNAQNQRFNDVWKFNRSQNNWQWISGDSTIVTDAPVYGSKNIPDINNRPGRDDASSVWSDTGTQPTIRAANQIWRYQVSARQWVWISGDSTVNTPFQSIPEDNGYSPKGVSSPVNLPASRKNAATWRDKSGFLWMFGGLSLKSPAGPLNDMWRYDPGKNEWAWMAGDTSRYDPRLPLGAPSAEARPLARYGAATWTDKEGNFWLFGGRSYLSVDGLWKFNPQSLEWTLVRGGYSTVTGIYGTQGVPAPDNTPGTRFDAATWTDTAGNLLLAGGTTGDQAYRLNEVWRYNIATGMWTWVSGNRDPRIFGEGLAGSAAWTDASGKLWSFGGNLLLFTAFANTNRILGSFEAPVLPPAVPKPDDPGFYGTKGVEGANTRPPARKYAVGWSDQKGNQYIYGGQFDTITNRFEPPQYFNDVWKFNPANSRWTWIGGDSIRNQSGDYGIMGMPSPLARAGSRVGFQSWSDPVTGRLWIFSGEGYPENGVGPLRDMLLFSPVSDAALPVRFGSFTAMQKGEAIVLSWTTLQEHNAAAFVIERSYDGLTYAPIGSVNAAGTTTAVSSYSFDDYSPLTGNNYYRLRQIDADNHFMYSEVKLVVIKSAGNKVSLLQNPVQSQLKLQFHLESGEAIMVQLKSTTGQLVISKNVTASSGSSIIYVDVAGIRSGLYYLHINGRTFTKTISILKK